MQFTRLIPLLALLLLPSCSVYKSNFDSSSESGVANASVTDLEQMIVETSKGPDLFLSNPSEDCLAAQSNVRKRVWISSYKSQKGCIVPGHYVYLQ